MSDLDDLNHAIIADTPRYKEAIEAGKPYFGYVHCSNQGNHRFKYFPKIVSFAGNVSRILEVGSYAGASLIAWDEASGKTAMLEAVDMWQPYFLGSRDEPHIKVMEASLASGEVFDLFWHNVRAAGIGPQRLTVHQGDSADILPKLSPGFDIVFIDGDHRYAPVKRDINNARLLVKVGGVLCGDDLDKQIPSLDAMHHQQLVAQGNPFENARDGEGYHPGVTQAVWDIFGEVQSFEGLWVMQKVSENDEWESVIL